jgi:hypothetical protein
MGTLHVALCQMNTRAETGMTMPLALSQPDAVATLSTTTTSARVGTLAATELDQVWVCTAIGNDMWVRASSAAASNAAGTGQGHLIPAGATLPLGVTAVAEQLAARDVV